MLYTLVVLLIILWLLGLLAHIGGSLVHILLVVALIVFIYKIATGRRPL